MPHDQKTNVVEQRLVLLQMAEALVIAHKLAKIDDDGYTLDLIEDALRYVGERLSKETGLGRNFGQKKLGPV